MSQMLMSKKQCLPRTQLLPDNLMRGVLRYLSNVSPCLAVSTNLVPEEYITSVKVLANFESVDLPYLLNKRKSITSVEFEESPYVTSPFLSNLIFFHVQLEKVVLRNVVIGSFPFINNPNTCYELKGNRWYMSFRDRKVEFVFEGNSPLLERVHNSAPDAIAINMFKFFDDTFNNNVICYYKEMVPYFTCSIEMMVQYRQVFRRPSVFSIGATKMNKDAAAVLVCTDVEPNRHFIVNFMRIDDTWKMTHVVNDCTHISWHSYDL